MRGESESPTGRYFELRAIAKATLNGLEGLLASVVELDQVMVIDVGENRFAMVVLSCKEDRCLARLPFEGTSRMRLPAQLSMR